VSLNVAKLRQQAGELDAELEALVGSGLELTAIETTFPKIPEVGTSAEVVGEPRRWRTKPGADPS